MVGITGCGGFAGSNGGSICGHGIGSAAIPIKCRCAYRDTIASSHDGFGGGGLICHNLQLVFSSSATTHRRTGPSFVCQTGNRTGSAVDGNRVAAAGRANGNAVGQFEADLVVGNRGLDIGIAGIFDGFAQFYGVVCTAVGSDLEAGVFQIGHGSIDGSIDCGINCTASYGTVVACRNVAAGQVGNLAVVTHINVFAVGANTVTVDDRAVVNCQAVGSQVRFGGNGNVFTVVGYGNVGTIFKPYRIIRLDGFRSTAVHLEFPTGVGRIGACIQRSQCVAYVAVVRWRTSGIGQGVGRRANAAIGLNCRSAAQVGGCGIGSFVQLVPWLWFWHY